MASAPPIPLRTVVVVMRHGKRSDAPQDVPDAPNPSLIAGADGAAAARSWAQSTLGPAVAAATTSALRVLEKPVSAAQIFVDLSIVASPFRRTTETAKATSAGLGYSLLGRFEELRSRTFDKVSFVVRNARPATSNALCEIFSEGTVRGLMEDEHDGLAALQGELDDVMLEHGGLQPGQDPRAGRPAWGESRDAAYARFRGAFESALRDPAGSFSQPPPSPPRTRGNASLPRYRVRVVVLVTHGDAVAATFEHVLQGSNVYAVEELGFALFMQDAQGEHAGRTRCALSLCHGIQMLDVAEGDSAAVAADDVAASPLHAAPVAHDSSVGDSAADDGAEEGPAPQTPHEPEADASSSFLVDVSAITRTDVTAAEAPAPTPGTDVARAPVDETSLQFQSEHGLSPAAAPREGDGAEDDAALPEPAAPGTSATEVASDQPLLAEPEGRDAAEDPAEAPAPPSGSSTLPSPIAVSAPEAPHHAPHRDTRGGSSRLSSPLVDPEPGRIAGSRGYSSCRSTSLSVQRDESPAQPHHPPGDIVASDSEPFGDSHTDDPRPAAHPAPDVARPPAERTNDGDAAEERRTSPREPVEGPEHLATEEAEPAPTEPIENAGARDGDDAQVRPSTRPFGSASPDREDSPRRSTRRASSRRTGSTSNGGGDEQQPLSRAVSEPSTEREVAASAPEVSAPGTRRTSPDGRRASGGSARPANRERRGDRQQRRGTAATAGEAIFTQLHQAHTAASRQRSTTTAASRTSSLAGTGGSRQPSPTLRPQDRTASATSREGQRLGTPTRRTSTRGRDPSPTTSDAGRRRSIDRGTADHATGRASLRAAMQRTRSASGERPTGSASPAAATPRTGRGSPAADRARSPGLPTPRRPQQGAATTPGTRNQSSPRRFCAAAPVSRSRDPPLSPPALPKRRTASSSPSRSHGDGGVWGDLYSRAVEQQAKLREAERAAQEAREAEAEAAIRPRPEAGASLYNARDDTERKEATRRIVRALRADPNSAEADALLPKYRSRIAADEFRKHLDRVALPLSRGRSPQQQHPPGGTPRGSSQPRYGESGLKSWEERELRECTFKPKIGSYVSAAPTTGSGSRGRTASPGDRLYEEARRRRENSRNHARHLLERQASEIFNAHCEADRHYKGRMEQEGFARCKAEFKAAEVRRLQSDRAISARRLPMSLKEGGFMFGPQSDERDALWGTSVVRKRRNPHDASTSTSIRSRSGDPRGPVEHRAPFRITNRSPSPSGRGAYHRVGR